MARKKGKKKRRGIPWGPGNPLWRWKHGRKSKKGKTSKRHKRRSNPSRRRRSYVARRKRSRRRNMTIPIAPIAGLAAGLAGPASRMVQGDFEGGLKELAYNYTGYNVDAGAFTVDGLRYGLVPLLAGFGVHWVASKLGINRMLGQARVPIVRI